MDQWGKYLKYLTAAAKMDRKSNNEKLKFKTENLLANRL